MAYDIWFERRAQDELREAQDTYGTEFREATEAWLSRLAAEAEARNHETSVDLVEWTESVLSNNPSSWGHSWRRWLSSHLGDQLRAVVAIAKKRCPPWELRTSMERFTVLGLFSAEVLVHFEVDHVHKRVIMRQFLGLPGQE